jgi:hypothetical protein
MTRIKEYQTVGVTLQCLFSFPAMQIPFLPLPLPELRLRFVPS